jgi:glycosyltransferase involved in cell wall biosynthesis
MIELLKSFRQNGHIKSAVVVMSERIQYPEIFELGIPVVTMVRSAKKDPLQFMRLYNYCKEFRPDIIHSWGSMASIYAIPAAKILKIKLISGNIADAPVHKSFWTQKYWWTRLSFPFSDLVVGNSQAGLKAYRAPAAKGRCVYNGFDFSRISELEAPEAVRKKYGIGPGKVIGMVGAFYERKDFSTFIRAAVQLLKNGRRLTFLAVGDGPLRESCAALVPQEYRHRILLPGLAEQVESLIRIFDIGVLCTNAEVHGEGVSNAVLEYMALGKPVVATRGGGTPEILVDGVTGFLVDPLEVGEIVEKISYLLDHPLEAGQMGAVGKKRVETHFSLSTMTRHYLDLYREVAN